MFMPALGETLYPARHRLAMALVLSLALAPAIGIGPLAFDSYGQLVIAIIKEVTIGVWIGLVGRIILSGLQFAGYQIGMVSGLANAFAPQMGSFEGATMVSTGLMLGAIAMIFATDLHHVIIEAVLLSYRVFPVGQLMIADMTQQIIRAVSESFYIGLAVSAPFFVMGFLMNLGLGLANRMMPNLPVFFVAAPILIISGFSVLVIAAPHMLREFGARFAEWLGLLTF
ncbi:flagellar biosynthetic protein FliR [Pseudooceanicola sp. LIPI14-2-Ac024]|uniref:flagellar biosynthetic protein FliR n=1 Tax=Pseudooceanicola sp. LIPI14-2-Ac024 TaxID=3344875 RepID=UPI0035D07095